MKSNDELIKEFESRRNLSLEEWQELMKKQSLSDDTEIQSKRLRVGTLSL